MQRQLSDRADLDSSVLHHTIASNLANRTGYARISANTHGIKPEIFARCYGLGKIIDTIH